MPMPYTKTAKDKGNTIDDKEKKLPEKKVSEKSPLFKALGAKGK